MEPKTEQLPTLHTLRDLTDMLHRVIWTYMLISRLLQSTSFCPRPVYGSTAKGLALLEHNHVLQLIVVDSVDVSAGFKAHPASGPALRHSIHGWDIDGAASIELERWLSAQGLKVNLGVGVVEFDQPLHWLLAGIKRYGRWVVIHDKAVVWVRLLGSKGELLVDRDTRKRFDLACWDIIVICDLVQVCRDVDLCSFYGRTIGDVEIAVKGGQLPSTPGYASATSPVICDSNCSFLCFVTDKLHFILDLKTRLGDPLVLLLAGRIP